MIHRKPLTYPNARNLRIRSRRGIPHFELDGGIYFVTYRVADSLPRHLIDRLLEERDRMRRAIRPYGSLTPMEHAHLAAIFGRQLDRYLDAGYGDCPLRNPRVAEIVEGALHYFDEDRYRLMAWSLMPNHVHVLMQLFRGRDLGGVMHSWKSFTANQANRILGRRGRFWQREYFDRLARDEREVENYARYIGENPAAAGLKGWRFVGTKGWWVE